MLKIVIPFLTHLPHFGGRSIINKINGFAYAPFGTLAFSDKVVVRYQKHRGNADIRRRHI